MMPATISAIRARTLRVNERTEWTILEVICSDGVTGYGEASINGMTAAFRAHTEALAARLEGASAVPNRVAAVRGEATGGLVQSAVASAAEQALWDAAGRRLGVPVTTLLGGTVRALVPVYANINRRTRERGPDGFAASARMALDAGYRFVKLAPFDGAGEGDPLGDDARVAAGLARVAGVCEAVGERAGVLIDCHWRLSETAAVRVIDFAAEHGLFWVECPVPEGPSAAPMLRRVRAHALRRGVRLAGLEKGERLADFRPAIEEGHYDVLMPDVKYDGGLAATRAIAELAATAGVAIALHNPTGPVCHAASVAVSATLDNALILEVQFGESPLFAALVGGEELALEDGGLRVSDRPGLGFDLDTVLMDELEVR
ncbi:MAG: galactonate dehydratase [Acuticoccus sp.]